MAIQCSYMDQKINYYKISRIELAKLDKNNKKSLLLHACCGPCACFPLLDLCPYFNVTIYFNNSNIYPSEEYFRRLEELKKLLEIYKKEYGYDIKIIETNYNNDDYNKFLDIYGDIKEGGIRCFSCYEKRMDEAYRFANENNFDYFTTVMSVSRQKNSQKLNEIGEKLSQKYPNTKYFYSDFKKNKGLEIGTSLRKKYNLYNQQYCGCVYSYKEYLTRKK